jgi:menaquinone-dependent protoporphyrinogen oxidase
VNKALIVYGTRYGATASTSQKIATILRQEGFDVQVINLKVVKIKDITPYDLIIVGSGIQINRWTGEPEDFLKRFQKQLAAKKVALFVSCGSASQLYADKPEDIAQTKIKYLDEKTAKYNLNPIAFGFFGGVYNFNKTPW